MNYKLILFKDGRNILVSDEKPDKNDYYIDYLVFPSLIQTPLQHSGVEYKEDKLNGVYKNPIIQSIEGTTSPKNDTNKVIAGYDTLPTLTYSDEVKQILRDKYGIFDEWEEAKIIFEKEENRKPNLNDSKDLLAVSAIHIGIKAHQSITNKMFSLEDVKKAMWEVDRIGTNNMKTKDFANFVETYIQSLQKPIQLNVEVQMEEMVNVRFTDFENLEKVGESFYEPKITNNSIHILKIL